MKFYIDFETINSNMGKCTIVRNNYTYVSNEVIFMISVGWVTDKFNYNYFTIKQRTYSEEKAMLEEFHQFIKN